jgi:hypothetical protein
MPDTGSLRNGSTMPASSGAEEAMERARRERIALPFNVTLSARENE